MRGTTWLCLPFLLPTPSVLAQFQAAAAAADVIGPTFRFGDFDADGLDDVYVVDPDASDRLFRNLGNGEFEDVTALHGLEGLTGSRMALWLDFDGDRALDLYLSNATGSSRLLQNTGTGMFVDVTAVSGIRHRGVELFAEALDIDADSRPDLHVVTEHGAVLYRNVGRGVFERAALPALASSGAIVDGNPSAVDLASLGGGSTKDGEGRERAVRRSRATRNSATGAPGTGGVDSLDAFDDSNASSGPLAVGNRCPQQIKDAATGSCISASTTPTLGMLYPLSNHLCVDGAGRVGVGTSSPQNALSVVGGISVDAWDGNVGTTTSTLRFGGGGSGEVIGSRRDGAAGSYGLDFYTGATNRMHIALSGRVGIGTNDPSASLHVSEGDGVLASGTLGSGALPATGPGTRFMWYPNKGALRAGVVTGTQWDDANIGTHSVALGRDTRASGTHGFAAGEGGVASGTWSTVLGQFGIASASYGIAGGTDCVASGFAGVALGSNARATGSYSAALNHQARAESQCSTAIGTYNIGGGSPNSWVATDPLFEIGNGASAVAKSNAMTVLKNGRVGIGRTPTANQLEVEGNASKTTATSWLANSDRRIKTEVHELAGALVTLARVRPVAFRYTDAYLAEHPVIEDREYYNVVAQEFAEVFPDYVRDSGENGILQVDTYPALIHTIAAVKELARIVEEKDARIASLEARIAVAEASIQANDARFAWLESALASVMGERR